MMLVWSDMSCTWYEQLVVYKELKYYGTSSS